MGMDIWSETGVIASTADMTGMLRKKDVKTLRETIQRFLKNEDWKKGHDLLGRVGNETSLEDICDALDSLVVVHGEPTKYGSDDCYVEDADEIASLWCAMLKKVFPELPSLKELTVFDSGRVNGWDVPHGEACFIFDASECFTETLSVKGRALKKAIGQCVKSEWTKMSV